MGLFRYEAIDNAGVSRSGSLELPSRAAVLEQLSRQGLVPLDVRESKVASGLDLGASRRATFRNALNAEAPVTPFELANLTQSWAALLMAGLTIDRALTISGNLGARTPVGRFVEDVGKAVRGGKTFAQGLATSGVSLPPYYLSMVEAGELGGSLGETLARIATLLQQQLQLRERVRSALVYPVILASVVLLTLIILLGFVLPRFELLFAESQATLPWMTRLVLAAGRAVADYGWMAAIILGVVGVLAYRWWHTAAGRERWDRWMLKSRLTMGLPASLQSARLLRTLSALLANGVPVPVAMRVARGTVSNTALLAALDGATQRVKAGETLATALEKGRLFPPAAVQMARVGEETGQLDALLLSAATVLEQESQKLLDRMLSLMVPLLTVGMGLVVAALIGSVLIGLLSINDLAA